MKGLLLLFSSLATSLVFAGSTLEAANDPRAMQLTYESWSKYCVGKTTCMVGMDARGACSPSGGSLAVITNQENVSLSASVFTKRMLIGAISVQVDQGVPILIPHPECNKLVCGSKVQMDSEFVERLKRSQTITIEATDTAHQKTRIPLSLVGFAQTYDGPETEIKVREETPENMKKMVEQSEKNKPPECQE
jgi:invasion protein IalB